jgi:hypothetical protein
MTEVQILILTLDNVNHLKKMHEGSSLNYEVKKVIEENEKFGFDRQYLDYI